MNKEFLQTLNHVDATNRWFKTPTFYKAKKPSQDDSHGMTYLQCREMLQELGQVMGLDRRPSDIDLEDLVDVSCGIMTPRTVSAEYENIYRMYRPKVMAMTQNMTEAGDYYTSIYVDRESFNRRNE